MKDIEISEIETKSKSNININHKVTCPCCQGSKNFRGSFCVYCDWTGEMTIENLNTVGIPYIILN